MLLFIACLFVPRVCVLLRFGTQSYDQHLNMVLGDVEETVTTVEVDEDTYEEIVRVSRKELRHFPVSPSHGNPPPRNTSCMVLTTHVSAV